MPTVEGHTSVHEKIRGIAEEVCRSESDVNKAAGEIVSRLTEEDFEAAARDLAYTTAQLLVENRQSQARRTLKAIAALPTRRTPETMVAGQNVRSILDMWVVNGTYLRDCKREDLTDAAEDEEKRAEGHAQNAKFYRTLAKRVGNGKTVAQSMTAAVVDSILQSVMKK